MGTASSVTDVGDPYEVCRFVQHYEQKNSYLPLRGMVERSCRVSAEYVDQLERNEVVVLIPTFEGGPRLKVGLTKKGRWMASAKRSRR